MVRQRITQKDLTRFEPRDRQLWKRYGLDRENIRYEFSNSNNLGLTDHFVEYEDKLYPDANSIDFADGPTGVGEGGSTGVNFLIEDGERIPTRRDVYGFSLAREDVLAGYEDAGRQRNAMMEMFDFENDVRFISGYDQGDGQWVPGVFEWLDENIPSDRIFDCSLYKGGESGDTADYTGVEENLIKFDAHREISNELMTVNNPSWGAMVGNQNALTHFHKMNEGSAGRASYWERLNTKDNSDDVGVDRLLWMPDEMTFARAPDGQDPYSVSLVDGNKNWDGLGDDEVYLLPDMEHVRNNLWRIYESPTPTLFSDTQEMGKVRFDYVNRYAHDFDMKGEHSDATDCVKLTNVSALYN